MKTIRILLKSEKVLYYIGMNALLEKLGKADAERFVALIIKEPFDYTNWQQNILEDLSVRELSKIANEFVKNR